MSKFKLFFTVFLMGLVPLPASAMMAGRSSINIDPVEFPDWYRFVEKHRCPNPRIEEIIQKSLADGVQHDRPYKLGELPYYYKGDQIDRIHYANRMKNYFTERGIKHFDVPNKFLCRVKDEWVVIAEEIEGKFCDDNELPMNEQDEFGLVCWEIRYFDIHVLNLHCAPNNKKFFIDTEERSFDRFTRDFPSQCQYDDPAIDFKNVKKQRELWRKDLQRKNVNAKRKPAIQDTLGLFLIGSAALVLHKCIVKSF